jgi:hypothetical protein
MGGMKPQMIADKRRDEVVAVVVTRLHAHLDGILSRGRRLQNQRGFELLFEKVIRFPLVNEDGSTVSGCLQQQAGVIAAPS